MALVVQKYGGSSVADATSIRRVAARIVATKMAGHQVVVAVSAMGDTTDELLDLAAQVAPFPDPRELDMLLTAGERISMSLLALAIGNMGHVAQSFTGSQAGLITDSVHGRAHIIDVTPGRITQALAAGAIVIVAGFQGVSRDTKDVTTFGRGGSDTTAVALAAALGAAVCEIYTDVDGVFTADPRIVPTARRLRTISYEEMLEMAASGAKVLHLRCVEYARRNAIPIHVRSSFSTRTGTLVLDPGVSPRAIPGAEDASDALSVEALSMIDRPEGAAMEQPIISGVAHDRSEAKVTVTAVPDRIGRAAAVFGALATAGTNLDMIVQNVSAATTGQTDISFTLPAADAAVALKSLEAVQDAVGYTELLFDDEIGKVSLVGAGMRSHPGVSATFFRALADAGVNVEMISTSEIRISVVVRAVDVDAAVRALHTAFGLDDDQNEAVVYAGTGR